MTLLRHSSAARRSPIPLAAVAGLLCLAGSTLAETPPGEQAGQAVRDAWIDGRLETTYALSPYLDAFAIDTDVENGIVHLSGTLKREIDRDLAIEIARSVEGVAEVKSSLTVESGADTTEADASGEGTSFMQRVRDAIATARVKTNLVANGSTKGLAIDVDTKSDVVTLKGAVPTRQEKMLAEMIARNTEGVTSVKNQLEIDEPS